jgi:hypothetical protein
MEQKMRKVFVFTILLLISFYAVNIPSGYCQVMDLQTETLYNQRVILLRENIRIGWTMGEVLSIMGNPERETNFKDGLDVVDVWGYRGYEVRIEFRNGFVSKWFFRFMP